MFEIFYTSQFKKDLKRIKKRSSQNFVRTREFVLLLKENGVNGIDARFKPHPLIGDFVNHWEAHIKPDLLIIWRQKDEERTIDLARLGSHSDLF